MTIQIDNSGQTKIVLESPPGKTLLEILSNEKVSIQSDFGLKGICGKCTMIAEPEHLLSQISSADEVHLSLDERQPGKRLACQARQINSGNIHPYFINTNEEKSKFVSLKIQIGSTFNANSPIKHRILNKLKFPIKKSCCQP